MNILYLGWIGHGNLGDDLLWDVFRSLADSYLNPNQITLIPSMPALGLSNMDRFDMVLLGGGSLITPAFIKILYNALDKNKEVGIWGSGMDRHTKDQIELLLNNRGTFKHSYKTDFLKKLAEIVEHSKYVGVRGPLTYAAFKQLGMNMRKVELSGDPGLLVRPSNRTHILTNTNLWNSGEKVVGINWGTTYNKLYGENEITVEDQLARTIKRLIGQGYKIYLYNVWGEDEEPSNRLFEKIGDTINVKKAPKLYHQNFLTQILSNCCFTINFKLHANVLSAAAGVPFIALGYRFKVYDFADSLDSIELVAPTDSLNLEQEILELADYIINNREDIVKKFSFYKHSYKNKLEQPFRKQFGLIKKKGTIRK